MINVEGYLSFTGSTESQFRSCNEKEIDQSLLNTVFNKNNIKL